MAGVVLERPTQESTSRHRPREGILGSGKIFITRHGERADLADEQWLAQADVSSTVSGLLDCSGYTLTTPEPATMLPQVIDDPPLTEQGLQQAHELGLRLQVC